MKERIDAALKAVIFGAISAAAGMAAFLFFVIAAFLWTQQHYDTIVACGVVGGMFLLLALISILALAVSRRRTFQKIERAQSEAASNGPPAWLTDPAAVLAAIQVARAIGFGRLIPLALVGVAGFFAAGLGGRKKPSESSTRAERRSAA